MKLFTNNAILNITRNGDILMKHNRLYSENPEWRSDKETLKRNRKKNRAGNLGMLGYLFIICGSLSIGLNALSIVSKSTEIFIDIPVVPYTMISYALLVAGLFLVRYVLVENDNVAKQLQIESQRDTVSQEVRDYSNAWNAHKKSIRKFIFPAYLLVILIGFIPTALLTISENQIIEMFSNQSNQLYLVTIPMMLGIVAVVLFIIPSFKALKILMQTPINRDPHLMINEVLNPLFDDFEFSPLDGISQEVLDSTHLVRTGIRYKSSNYMSGSYRHIKFKQADIDYEDVEFKITESRDTESKEYHIFKGRLLIIESEKRIEGNIIIKNKYFKNSDESHLKKENYIKVETEDQTFNKMYDVYSLNEHEAFYILTPAIMSRLMKFGGYDSDENYREGVSVSFLGNMFTIAISNIPETFYGLTFVASSHQEVTHRILSEAKLITDTIDAITVTSE